MGKLIITITDGEGNVTTTVTDVGDCDCCGTGFRDYRNIPDTTWDKNSEELPDELLLTCEEEPTHRYDWPRWSGFYYKRPYLPGPLARSGQYRRYPVGFT